MSGPSELAEIARANGLQRIGSRPGLRSYLRDVWAHRAFVTAYAKAKVQASHRRRRLGGLWQVLDPLLTMAFYWVMFGVLLGARGSVDNYIGFLATGVFTFAFIRQSFNAGAKSIGGNSGLISGMPFPTAVLPVIEVMRQVRIFAFSLPIMIAVLLLTGERPRWDWLLSIAAVALVIPFALGGALLLARLIGSGRDASALLPYALRVWGFASGVMLPIADRLITLDVPAPLVFVAEFNPGAVYLTIMRDSLLGAYDSPGGAWNWLAAVMWSVAVLVVGVVAFWWNEGRRDRD